MGLRSERAYPSLKGIGEDCRALRIVSPAYAGREGELTATLQYVYQSISLGACGEEETARILMEIASVEMRHIEILGTLIARLGAPPVFTACPPYPVGFYSASCVNYARAPEQMILADICAERASAAAYERMLGALQNEGVREVVARLLEDEKLHLAALEALYREKFS